MVLIDDSAFLIFEMIHNKYFKTTLASLLNRDGQVLAWPTGTTFSYKRSSKDNSGERVVLLPGTTYLHINRP